MQIIQYTKFLIHDVDVKIEKEKNYAEVNKKNILT